MACNARTTMAPRINSFGIRRSAFALLVFATSLFGQTPKENLQRNVGTNTIGGTQAAAPFKVETIASLKAVVGGSRFNGQQVDVAGYYVAGDGGGGQFQFNSASSATDNGGTVIAPTVGTGRWLRVYDGGVFLEWFGGGAGKTESQNDTAFSRAMGLGGTIQLQAGDYAVGARVQFMVSKTRLIGAGSGATRLVNNEPVPTFIGVYADTLTDIVVDGVTYVSGSLPLENASEHAFFFYQCDKLRVRDIQFGGMDSRFDKCTEAIITESRCVGGPYIGFIITDSTRVTFTRNYAQQVLSGVMTEAAYDVSITDNKFYDCYGESIRIEDSQNVTVTNNISSLCARGITVYGPQSGFTDYTQDIIVANNTFDRCYKTATTSPYSTRGQGWQMDARGYVRRVSFLGNHLIAEAGAGTLVSDFSTNTTVNAAFATTVENQAIVSASSYNLARSGNRVYVEDVSTNYSAGWIFYVNVPAGIDLSVDRFMMIDLYWHTAVSMDQSTLGVRYYSAIDRAGTTLGTSDLYNSGVNNRALPSFFTVPAGLNNVKCIEFYLKKSITGVSFFVYSQLLHGLQGRVGYVHDFLNGDISNIRLSNNRASNIPYPLPLTFTYPLPPPNTSGNSWDLYSLTFNPGNLANAGQQLITISSIATAQPGSRVDLSFDGDLLGTRLYGECFQEFVRVYQLNMTGVDRDVSSGTLTLRVSSQ